MKIAIVGSTQYLDKMKAHRTKLIHERHDVGLPYLDGETTDVMEIMHYNLDIIRWADEVHLFWDCRSPGAWGDFCMAFALGKVVRAIFLETKSMRDVVEAYAQQGGVA